MSQKSIFLQGEGDSWYSRNAALLNEINPLAPPADVLYLLETLRPFRDEINSVLEIGCSNGVKLQLVCEQFNAIGHGLDPSTAAVEEGNNRRKSAEVNLQVGTSDNLPFETGSVDLVNFAFCLYLVDRDVLLKSIAEADRVLRPGGFLAITDFDPGYKHRRHYNHKDGVFSFKQDYAGLFTGSGLYYLFGKHSFSHRYDCLDKDPNERVSTSLLVKEIEAYPAVG